LLVGGKNEVYKKGVYRLKLYRDRFRLTYLETVRQKGWEDRQASWADVEKKDGENTKEKCNLIRAKSKIFEYAICNQWEYFITGTIDQNKYDRFDLKAYYKRFAKFINNQQSSGIYIKYLIIPEQHSNGAWHIHGLIKGLPESELTDFIPGIHPKKLIDKGYKNWSKYADRFGFVSLGMVKDDNKIASYLSKYITKAIKSEGAIKLGDHIYYCSQGLNKALDLGEVTVTKNIEWDWENIYCKIKYIDIKDIEKYVYIE